MAEDSPDGPVNRDVPLRLTDAVKIAFPMGGMTVSGLRREAARGRLIIEKIAGKDFVTLRAIEEMRERCRVQRKEPFSSQGVPPAPASARPSESSRTEDLTKAQAAFLATAEALKRTSKERR